jgi:hypothetical protein
MEELRALRAAALGAGRPGTRSGRADERAAT